VGGAFSMTENDQIPWKWELEHTPILFALLIGGVILFLLSYHFFQSHSSNTQKFSSSPKISSSLPSPSLLPSITVSQLMIYPIKSCAGISLEVSEITASGLKYDRIFALMNGISGGVVTLQSKPKMTTILPKFSSGNPEILILTAPNSQPIEISLEEDQNPLIKLKMRVRDHYIDVYEVDPMISQWVCEAIGEKNLKFVRYVDALRPWHTPSLASPLDDAPVFLSGHPFLMISEESLKDFNQRLPSPSTLYLTTQRFRPNIVIRVEGLSPYSEDQCQSVVTSSGIFFSVAKLCDRCVIPNVHPTTGVLETSLLMSKTLRSYRTGKELRLKSEWEDRIFFGVNLVVSEIRGDRRIFVGDEVTLDS
jgi:uncharacterized protein